MVYLDMKGIFRCPECNKEKEVKIKYEILGGIIDSGQTITCECGFRTSIDIDTDDF